MIGYATNETEEFMPLSHLLASLLCEKLDEARINNALPWLRPDGKAQVTVEYKVEGNEIKPLKVHTVLISTQHSPDVTQSEIESEIKEKIIKAVIPSQYLDDKTVYHINPSGSFTIGGPTCDAGLTGRKIIVDTYGGWGGHGGGCFSGKDPSKIDRTASYAARWVAKSLVASGLCNRVQVQLAYGIGLINPISVNVNSYGTVKNQLTDFDLDTIVEENFDLRPGMLIKNFNLKRPIFQKLSAYGHFGRNDPDFAWETPKMLRIPQ